MPWGTLRGWLADVPIEDPKARGNAVVIQVVGSLGVAGFLLAAVHRGLHPGPAGDGTATLLAAAAVLGLAVVLVRLGHYLASLWTICAAVFLNVALPMAVGGVTYGLGFTRELCIPLAIAALLMDRRALWTMFALVVAVCSLGAAREAGLLGPFEPRPVAVPPFGAFGSTVVIFFFIVVVLDRLTGALHASLAHTREREEAVRESEANLRLMLDLFPDAAVLSRLDPPAFVAVSGGFTRNTGLSMTELADRAPTDFQLWADPADRDRYIEAVRRDGTVADFETRFLRPDGSIAAALIWGKVITIRGVPHLLTIIRDITEWKRTQQERDRMQEQVQHAQRLDSLGSLAGGVAHDFNNMLGGIMGFADLLLEGERDPVRSGHLRAIVKAASRSGELTRKLLAFGRKGRNLVEPVNLQGLAQECLALLRPTMSPDLEAVVSMEDCPTVDGDPGQLHQVIFNLCLNALEAMPGKGRITVSARRRPIEAPGAPDLLLPPGDYVELEVADTGAGMSEEVRQRVFEPFFTTKTEGGKPGTGLGLSTVYGIVHSHRGAVEVESEPGRGSRFRVLLPVGILAVHTGDSGPIPRLGQGEVLLVEDEPLLREAAASALRSLGYTVHEAADGAAGVAAFAAHHAGLHAVLLDLKMPVMGGREAFHEMHRIDPAVPVVVCTGFGENEEVQALRTAGAVGMLAKPYRIKDLQAALRRLSEP